MINVPKANTRTIYNCHIKFQMEWKNLRRNAADSNLHTINMVFTLNVINTNGISQQNNST